MNKSLSTTFLFLCLPLSAQANTPPSASIELCGPAPVVQRWKYTFSGDSIDNVRTTTGYAEIAFKPVKTPTGETHQIIRLPLEGLNWDNRFERLWDNSRAVPVVCARNTIFGQRKFRKDCDLAMSAVPVSDPAGECGSDGKYLFSAELIQH